VAHPFDPAPHYAPRGKPAKALMIAKVLAGVGLAAFVAGLFMDPTRTRAMALICLVYFTGLSFGGLIFAVVQTLTLARWGRPLKRIAESFFVFAPIGVALLFALLLTGGLHDLYEWAHSPELLHGPHKPKYLQPGWFYFRLAAFMGVLLLLGRHYLRNSLRADLGVASEKLDGKHPAWWGRFIQDWQGEATEVAACQKRMMTISPFYAIAYAVGLSFFAFDVVMSLNPHWYSNMFGGWFFCSCLWLAFIWSGMVSIRGRRWLGLEGIVDGAWHDLGKLVLAFSMVWAYMFYAQLLPIWYGNMTEEIGFLLVRLKLEPWTYVARLVGVMCFLVPFGAMTSRGLKKMPTGFFLVLVIAATGVFLERFLVTMPNVWFESTLPLGPIEIAMAAGMAGLFLTVVLTFLGSVPPVPVSDPYMQPHPDDVHVTPSRTANAH